VEQNNIFLKHAPALSRGFEPPNRELTKKNRNSIDNLFYAGQKQTAVAAVAAVRSMNQYFCLNVSAWDYLKKCIKVCSDNFFDWKRFILNYLIYQHQNRHLFLVN
jgi:hypothetical protein